VSELSERLSVGSLDLSPTSSEDEEEEEQQQLHHAALVGVVGEDAAEEHDQEYTIYDHVPLQRESSQFSLNGEYKI
jgi:hypothetical protein